MVLLDALINRLDQDAHAADSERMGMRPPAAGMTSPSGGKMPAVTGPRMGLPSGPGMGGAGPASSATPMMKGAAPTPSTTSALGPGPGTMGPANTAPAASPADSDRRLKQLEDKLDRLEKLLQRMEAERIDRDLRKELDDKVKNAKQQKQ
jgi:hypothetical protein